MARARKVQTPGQVAPEPEAIQEQPEVAPEPEAVPVAPAREGAPKWQMTEHGWDLI